MDRLDLTAACFATALLLALGAAWPAQSRETTSRETMSPRPVPAKSAPAAEVRTASSEGLACAPVRRKLWTESEGWIVRKVAVCR